MISLRKLSAAFLSAAIAASPVRASVNRKDSNRDASAKAGAAGAVPAIALGLAPVSGGLAPAAGFTAPPLGAAPSAPQAQLAPASAPDVLPADALIGGSAAMDAAITGVAVEPAPSSAEGAVFSDLQPEGAAGGNGHMLAAARRLIDQRMKEIRAAFGESVETLEPPPDTPRSIEDISLDDPSRTSMASPEDWRDEIFYSVMIDRFSRGKDSKPLGDPKSGLSRHGGDIRGITDRLDYLQGLGVTAIILSPVMMGIPEAYHGYAPTRLLAVDPYLGTMEDFKTLVAEAHKRGLRIIMDLVANHAGPVFEYKDGSRWKGMQGPAKEIGEWTETLWPVELAQSKHFSARGEIENWNDPDQAAQGDFPPNYRHWAADRRETQDLLIKVALFWLKETDVDGFRLDAIRHINPEFVKRLAAELRDYAAKMGKDNLFLLGEHASGIDNEVIKHLRLGIDSAYNYPEYRRNNKALHGLAPASDLQSSFMVAQRAMGGMLTKMVRFIDNHDVYRFLRKGEAVSILKLAFAFMYFSTGIPLVYYGTEQAMRQSHLRMEPEDSSMPADPENREDMFPEGSFKSDSSAGDKFDAGSETYRWARRLADLRKAFPALRRGEQWVRWADSGGPGIFAFSRIHEQEEVIVVLNTATEERSATFWVDADLNPAGSRFSDELDPDFKVLVRRPPDGGSQLSVTIPANGVRVLVRRKS